jgi:hypothetical protein
VITASAARRALTRKARRARLRRLFRAALAAVAREERAAAEPGEEVEVRYVSRSLARSSFATRRPGVGQRIGQLCDDHGCPCSDCEEARQRDPMEERTPRHVPLTGEQLEQLAIHEAHTARELALWHALVWGPEAAAEAARFRSDDRAADSAWARLRLVLEALGVVSPLWSGHDPLRLADRWLEACPSHGPPVAVAALEAPVISP